jgi:hypothetical protein
MAAPTAENVQTKRESNVPCTGVLGARAVVFDLLKNRRNTISLLFPGLEKCAIIKGYRGQELG